MDNMTDKEFTYQDLINAYLQGNATADQKDKLYEWASSNEENYKTFLQIKNLTGGEYARQICSRNRQRC